MNLSSSAAIPEAPGHTRTPHPPHLPDLRLQLAGVGALGAAAGGTVFRVHTSGGRPLGGSLCRQVLHWEWSADLPTPAACVCVTPVRTAGRATVDMGFMPRLASLSWIWALPQPPRGGCAQRGTGARWGLLPQGPPGRAALAGPIPAAGRASCPPATQDPLCSGQLAAARHRDHHHRLVAPDPGRAEQGLGPAPAGRPPPPAPSGV